MQSISHKKNGRRTRSGKLSPWALGTATLFLLMPGLHSEESDPERDLTAPKIVKSPDSSVILSPFSNWVGLRCSTFVRSGSLSAQFELVEIKEFKKDGVDYPGIVPAEVGRVYLDRIAEVIMVGNGEFVVAGAEVVEGKMIDKRYKVSPGARNAELLAGNEIVQGVKCRPENFMIKRLAE